MVDPMSDQPIYGVSPLRAAYRHWWLKEQMWRLRLEYLRRSVSESTEEYLRRIVGVPSPRPNRM